MNECEHFSFRYNTLIQNSFSSASDKFVSDLKSSLGIEKQKNSLLSEELKIKKGTVERLRSDLENTKEQLEYVKEEKGELNLNVDTHKGTSPYDQVPSSKLPIFVKKSCIKDQNLKSVPHTCPMNSNWFELKTLIP